MSRLYRTIHISIAREWGERVDIVWIGSTAPSKSKRESALILNYEAMETKSNTQAPLFT